MGLILEYETASEMREPKISLGTRLVKLIAAKSMNEFKGRWEGPQKLSPRPPPLSALRKVADIEKNRLRTRIEGGPKSYRTAEFRLVEDLTLAAIYNQGTTTTRRS